ncbi:hypothetical protein A3841_09345 [Pontibacter flavimaris]|uniref:Uncharacterized protein n=1 Tax=Pontibacter flavimaris TaxID=1797110 RepID=A0A1Q5PIY8_9BACT|nr:hypothetical protein A3841_09345 [Pontibacter flavimaris]
MKSQQRHRALLIDINIKFVFIAWKGTLHCGVFFYFYTVLFWVLTQTAFSYSSMALPGGGRVKKKSHSTCCGFFDL